MIDIVRTADGQARVISAESHLYTGLSTVILEVSTLTPDQALALKAAFMAWFASLEFTVTAAPRSGR